MIRSEQLLGALDDGLEGLQELGGVGAVDDAVVRGQVDLGQGKGVRVWGWGLAFGSDRC
jgi:hypothetical protein